MTLYEHTQFLLWKKVHTLPAWFIERWQLRRLRHIVSDAYNHIPLYRSLLVGCGISPQNIQSLKALVKLPILSRKIFTTHQQNEYVRSNLPDYYYKTWGATSGSTGEPFRFVCPVYDAGHAEMEKKYFSFKRWRFLTWRNVPFEHIFRDMKVVRFRMRRTSSDPLCFFIDPDVLYSDPERVIQDVQAFGADIIVCYASALVELCEVLRKNDLGGAMVFKYAVSSGEFLTDAQRSIIEETLSCELYNRYGLEEFYRTVGVECKEHNGFHLNDESYILEVVDEKDAVLPTGLQGRIVITDLYNSAMPFIRYDTGDYGTILGNTCPCGLQTTRFTIGGRQLVLSFGEQKVHYNNINRVFIEHVDEVLQWQARKVADDTLEIVIIKGFTFNNSLTVDQIVQELSSGIHNDIKVSVRPVKTIERTGEDVGKCKIFVDVTKSKEK